MEVTTRKKIICVATPLYAPQIGGPATHVSFLEQNLSSDFDLRIIKFSDVVRYPKGIKHIVYFFKVLISARGADMVYSLDPVSVGFPALLASKVLRKKFVLRVGGDYAWEQGVQRFGVEETLDEFIKNTQRSSFVRTLQVIQSYVARHALKVVAPSTYLASIVAKWGVDANHIQVVYSQPEILESKQSREAARKSLGVHENEQIIFSAGRLVPWKGFSALLEVVTVLPDGYLLVIAGAGPGEASLKKKAEEFSVSNKIRFLGQIPKEEMHMWLHASDIFVLNTKYEGLSHMLLEVFAAGLPVITTPVGGNVELVEDGKTGLFVQPDDVSGFANAIERVFSDSALRATLVKEARGSLSRFNTEIAAQTLTSLLISL